MKTHPSLTPKLFVLLLAAACAPVYSARPDSITVQVDQPGIKISPTFYGLMTEEINHSYDGGLYAELLRNRVFKDNARNPVNWTIEEADGASVTTSLDTNNPLNSVLDTSLRLDVTAATDAKRAGVANRGYWGIPVKPGTRYTASFYAKAAPGFTGPVNLSIESEDGATVFAQTSVRRLSADWKRYSVILTTGKSATPTEGKFVLAVNRPGTIWLNLVSLFPPTYNNRPNGNRIDLMELLDGMKPSFLRLPGGNYLEGDTIETRFEWKNTIGDLAGRAGHQGPWSYRSSDGMGLLEFLEWCEDLKMQPVLAVYAGYSLRGAHVEPGPGLGPYVQDALDEIEYVTGDAKTTKWGAERAKDGHHAPFKLTYVEIGNEDFFDKSKSYDGRYAQFYDAIKATYPNLQLIATTPVTSRTPDVVDDHYYRSARAMESDSVHYDKTDRNGPKIFVGEWATTEGSPTPTMNAALGDAAWLTGLERDSDVVVMEAYAPLLVNVNRGARQWATDLIGYDGLNSFASPSYYVQKMFASSHGTFVLPVSISAAPEPALTNFTPAGGIGVGTWGTHAEFRNLKVTHNGETLYQDDFANGFRGWRREGGEWATHDGVLAQNATTENIRATTGSRNWTDYTYELQARKIDGAEGFIILFHAKDPDNYIWFNVGGWNNTRTALEKAENGAKSEIGTAATNTVEAGRWYDVKIELQGADIRCYLDGQQVIEATDPAPPQPDPIYANATGNPATGEVFLHVVNVTGSPRQVQFNLNGATKVADQGTSEVLSGEPLDVNTLEEPNKLTPKTSPLTGVAASFTHELPPHSVSVIMLKAK